MVTSWGCEDKFFEPKCVTHMTKLGSHAMLSFDLTASSVFFFPHLDRAARNSLRYDRDGPKITLQLSSEFNSRPLEVFHRTRTL
jgi:hypothetical protein